MKLRVFVTLSILAACSTHAPQSQQQSGSPMPLVRSQGTARGASQEEIAAAFIGKTVDFSDGGVSKYGTDGRYTFTFTNFWDNDRSAGTYSIRPSTICVKFDDGFSRCDTIYVDNGKFTLVNKDGKSFELRIR
jgi:hypothetical protein